MDYLQEGIGLRAMGQRDPLVEYQREGFDLFNGMMEAIKEESVGFLFNVEVKVEGADQPAEAAQAVPAPLPPADLVATGPGEAPGEVVSEHLLNDEDGDEDLAPRALPEDFGRPERPQQLEYTAPAFDSAPGSTGVERSSGPAVGTGTAQVPEQQRNDPCSCGSGRKYKRCHGAGRD
jgi:preprotein translocase subunit SecA